MNEKTRNNKDPKIIIEGLIDFIRYTPNTLLFYTKKNIVPENQDHLYLHRRFSISSAIWKFYVEPTKVFLTPKYLSISNDRNAKFLSKTKEGLLKPYPVVICGAYHSRNSILCLLEEYKGKPFEYLLPFFKDYSQGFKEGFDKFENRCIEPYILEASEKSKFFDLIFEYFFRDTNGREWLDGQEGITEKISIEANEVGTKDINFYPTKGFDEGLAQGYYYKAWSIVFSHYEKFNQKFESYFKALDRSNRNEEKYKLKEIKIAYFCLGERINKNNYLGILKRYSDSSSDKILQNPIVKTSQLTAISENKTTDSKHLESLKNAERLLLGMNDKEALNSLKQITSTFQDNFRKKYE